MKLSRFNSKLTCLLVCLLLVLSLLVSCGNETSTPSTGEPTDKPEPSSSSSVSEDDLTEEFTYDGSAPVTDELKKFSILTTNSASLIYDFDNMTWWQEALKRANIELDMELVDSSAYGDVVRPRLAAAVDLPDAILLPNKDDDMSYLNSGIFMELSTLYDEYGHNLGQQFEKNPNLRGGLTTPDGEIFYIPYIYTTSDNARCLMINTDFVEAVGMEIEDIKNLDDYYDYLVAVKENDVNGNGDASDEIPLFMRAGMISLWGMYWGLDLPSGYQVTDNGTVICGYADERYLEMLTYLNKLYTEGLLNSEFATANFDAQTAAFTNNQIGSIVHFISNATGYSLAIDPEWDFHNDEPIILPIEPIEGPYGDKPVYGRDAMGSVYGITTSCEDPETLFSFFDYLFSEEVGVLTWYGIEGVDYTLNNGTYEFSEQYLANADNYRGNNGYNFAGLPSFQYGYMSTQCLTVREVSASYADYVMNPSITFSYKLPEENEIIQAYAADLSTYFAENLVAFITGTKPLSEWDSYINTLESLSLSEMIKVHQASVDRREAVN